MLAMMIAVVEMTMLAVLSGSRAIDAPATTIGTDTIATKITEIAHSALWYPPMYSGIMSLVLTFHWLPSYTSFAR